MITTTSCTTTPKDFSLKSAYLNMKAQKLYFPLSYAQYKYTFMLEDDSEITEIKVNRLIQKWFDAAKNNISTDKKIKLTEKTNLFTDSVRSEGLEFEKNILHLHHLSNLMNHAINQHSEDELNDLTLWLKQNTVWHPVLEGMYPVFTRLYDQAICKNININPTGIALYNKVRTGSISHTFKFSILLSGGICNEKIKKYIEEAGKFEKADFSILGDNIPKILEKLEIKDLLNFHKVNRENRHYASYELACRLQKLEIFLSDIVKLDENAEINIKFLLGDFYSKIDNIEIDSGCCDFRRTQTYTSLPVLYMDFIKIFSNLKHLHIHRYQNVDFSILPFCEKIESVILHTCTINNFDSKNLNNIKTLKFTNCSTDDFKIDNPCPTVEVLRFVSSKVENLNYLQFFPNLREFVISDLSELDKDRWEVFSHCPKLEKLQLITCHVKDFDFLKHLKNLRELGLGTSAKQLTDTQLLEILTFCPNLKTIDLRGCDQISDTLVAELREKNITITGKAE